MPLIPPVMVLNSMTVKPSVLVRVGVSFISEAQACSNAETEIPDFDFAGVRKVAFDTWNELLGRIQVQTQGVKSEIVELLYSSSYRTHISPADCKTEHYSVGCPLRGRFCQIPARTPSGIPLSRTMTHSIATLVPLPSTSWLRS